MKLGFAVEVEKLVWNDLNVIENINKRVLNWLALRLENERISRDKTSFVTKLGG
jgi:hypothetical protein